MHSGTLTVGKILELVWVAEQQCRGRHPCLARVTSYRVAEVDVQVLHSSKAIVQLFQAGQWDVQQRLSHCSRLKESMSFAAVHAACSRLHKQIRDLLRDPVLVPSSKVSHTHPSLRLTCMGFGKHAVTWQFGPHCYPFMLTAYSLHVHSRRSFPGHLRAMVLTVPLAALEQKKSSLYVSCEAGD